jgi:hypothetical protein
MEKEIERIKEIYADCNLTVEEAMEIYKAENRDDMSAGTIWAYMKCPARVMFSGCKILK